MRKNILTFPNGFYWGSSTSAHQVEGNNHNDWSHWEKENAHRLASEASNKWQNWQVKKFPEMLQPENYISGKACDHYNRYEEDFDIAKSLNQNAHRFSIEWSRIEPEEGKFNGKEIEHYRKVILALKKRGLEPFVTLCHYTIPVWLANYGGLECEKFPSYFSRFAEKVVREYKGLVKFWITFNEPTVLIAFSYLFGTSPPQKKSVIASLKAYKKLAVAHINVYQVIHRIDLNSNVGFAHNMKFIEPKHTLCLADQLIYWAYKYLSNDEMYKLTAGTNDFIALQYYFHDVICILKMFRVFFQLRVNRRSKKNFFLDPRFRGNDTGRSGISDMGWEIFPEGIYHVLRDLKKYDKPIYITENGLADRSDRKRKKFIKDHLFWIHKALSEGIDVRGYFYWSLLDNFEWADGFWPRFGLVEVNRKTMKRTVRPSAREYAKICRTNTLVNNEDRKVKNNN